jgi:hypothetical protein
MWLSEEMLVLPVGAPSVTASAADDMRKVESG